MTSPLVNVLAAWWALGSALALALLAIAVVRGGRARPWGAFAFGAFLAVWAARVTAANLARIASDAASATTWTALGLALALPLPFLLLSFAAEQGGSRVRGYALASVAGAVALATGALYALEPGLFLQGTASIGGVYYPAWGPLYQALIAAPFFLATALALHALATALARAPTPRVRQRASILLAGLGVYASFAAGNNATVLVWSLLDGVAPDEAILAATFLILLGVVAWGALVAWRARLPWLAAALALPAAYGALEGVVQVNVAPLWDTVGLWRLAGAGVIAYGLLRLRIYDLPARARGWAATTAGAGGALAAGAATFGVSSALTAEPAVPLAAGALVTLALAVPGLRLARKWLASPKLGEAEADDPLFGSRLEAYRAALESSVARGTLDEDAEFLATLRERFGIGGEAHRVLLHYARGAVISAREGDAHVAYERLRLLGEGGAGRTWLARDRVRDRIVVLKEPIASWHEEPSVHDAMLREARLAAKVKHANVVAVQEVVTDGRAAVIVMEYMEGGSLADLLRARGSLPWRDALRVVSGTLAGLEAVHAAGILHRDIKPSNILLTREGEPKIADFGIAAPLTGSGRTRVATETGTTRAGTLSYMAPEVRDGRTLGTVRSDVYACAAVLHECLFGAPPGARPVVVTAGEVPARVAAVLSRALSADPQDRPASARELAVALASEVVA